jgi:hypothetical protein
MPAAPQAEHEMTTGQRIVALLPATSRQLLRKIRISTSTLHKWLTRLRDDDEIHIGDWNRSVGNLVAVWTAGSGPDAPRLPPLTGAKVTANYRKRKRAEARQLAREKAAALKKAEKARFTNDPLMAALYGKPKRKTASKLSKSL